jgi:two-component system CheB/CheR fusion protein
MARARQPKRRGKSVARFPIAGVGGSAGGLDAFSQLLKHLPVDTGIAIVVVQHLGATHESELTSLLSRATKMPTQEVTDDLQVLPDHVYVIPPNASMTIVKGVLKLAPRPEGRTPPHPIDVFFESLAHDQGDCAIGVVLSGAATDGTLGLEAIKAEGGIAFAQDATAKYDSMPRSAIAAGCVDFIMSPAEIAAELARIAQHPYVLGAGVRDAVRDAGERERASAREDETPEPSRGRPRVAGVRATITRAEEAAHSGTGKEPEGFKKILLRLRAHSGVDFSRYKSTTIERRIARRMVLSNHTTFSGYAKFLRDNARELDTLFSDVLISVTSFFRNPDAFDVLKRVVFPDIVKRRVEGPVRVWVLGCSTGQEAYSIAMAFLEAMESVTRAPAIQIFATDLNDASLAKARIGVYPKSLAEELDPARLRRFFVETDGGYRVIKSLRDSVVFAHQDVITDPPFSRVDLVCCRNLLIYLEQSLQTKALTSFHYALKPGGYLFLGASESIGQLSEFFTPVDHKHKIFSKKAALAGSAIPMVGGARHTEHTRGPKPQALAVPAPIRTELSAQYEADRLIINQFAPPSVVVNADLQILQFRGATEHYLAPARGKASLDVLKMARDGLMLPLRATIGRARKTGRTVRKENIRIVRDRASHAINIEVTPLRNLKERCYLILFEDAAVRGKAGREAEGAAHRTGAQAVRGDGAGMKILRQRLALSEREHAETRDYLQAIQEQYEATAEELQAASEESQSANEELQSINEELETSKEELESTNEELTTINEEMAHRNTQLNQLNEDLHNLHVSSHAAIVVLSGDLKIRRFTPLAEKEFDLASTDIGQSFSRVRHHLYAPPNPDAPMAPARPADLDALVRDALGKGGLQEHELRDADGHWYALRIRPYATLDGTTDGAVLVLVDIDVLKRSEEALVGALSGAEAARDYSQAIIRTMRDPLLVLDKDLRVKTANSAFYSTFQLMPKETENRFLYDIAGGEWNVPALRRLLDGVLTRNDEFNDFEVTGEFREIGRRSLLISATRLDESTGAPGSILLSMYDMTARRRMEEMLRTSEASRHAAERFAFLADSIPQKIFTASASGEVDYFNPQWIEYTGLTLDQILGWGWTEFIHPDDLAGHVQAWTRSIATGAPFHFEQRFRRADGTYRWHVSRSVPVRNIDGRIATWVGSSTDVNDIKEADRHKEEFLAMLGHELRNPLAPIRSSMQLLRNTGSDSDRGRRAVEMMHHHVGRVVRLVDDLLDVGRINHGKIALHRERAEIGPLILYAVDAARAVTDLARQDLTVSLPSDPVYLDIDHSRMTQVLSNLLDNASKYTPAGGHIQVSVEQDGVNATIRVRDSGIGIAADDLPRIFNLFTQIDGSRDRAQGGLGLGLPLARRLVELHDGVINAFSDGLGHGTEFAVRLPLSVEAEPEPEERGRRDSDPVRRRRILVVDDNKDAAISLGMLLELSGHEVHVAHDGIEAVERAAALQPDIIFLDIGLPKLSGVDAARQIRSARGGSSVLLVALTGRGSDEDRVKSAAAGFDHHLIKPVDFTVVEALVNAVSSGTSI